MDLKKKYVVNPLIVLREEFDDWAVLFDPDTGYAHGVDPTGVFIWKQLEAQHSVDDIINGLQNNFDEVPENAKKEVNEFLNDLKEHGYIADA
jgi:SynChlorMet cassette protein ScmD